MDILNFITESTKESDAFEHHPMRELALEERLLYLYGLSLVMNADGTIDEDEKEYLRILITSFDMDASTLDDCVEFAQAPDKESAQAFFRTFRRCPIAQLFLFDALMMSSRDGNIDESEAQVLVKIAEQLEVAKGIYQDIYDLFCHIKNKDWDESSLYFSTNLLNPDHFKHILDYFGVDFDELTGNYTALKQKRLKIILNEKIGRNIKGIPNDVLLDAFQIAIDRNEIKIVRGVLLYKDKEVININKLGFTYNQVGKLLSIKEDKVIHDFSVYIFFLDYIKGDVAFLYSSVVGNSVCKVLNIGDKGQSAKLSRKFTEKDVLIDFKGNICIYTKGKYNSIYDCDEIYSNKKSDFRYFIDNNFYDNDEIKLRGSLYTNSYSRGKLTKATNEQIINLILEET